MRVPGNANAQPLSVRQRNLAGRSVSVTKAPSTFMAFMLHPRLAGPGLLR
jgi:hypothetical protein